MNSTEDYNVVHECASNNASNYWNGKPTTHWALLLRHSAAVGSTYLYLHEIQI